MATTSFFRDCVEAMTRMAMRENADIVIGDYVRHLDRFGLFRRKDGAIPENRVVERQEFLSSYYSGFFGMDRYGLFYTYGKMCTKLYGREFLLGQPSRPKRTEICGRPVVQPPGLPRGRTHRPAGKGCVRVQIRGVTEISRCPCLTT